MESSKIHIEPQEGKFSATLVFVKGRWIFKRYSVHKLYFGYGQYKFIHQAAKKIPSGYKLALFDTPKEAFKKARVTCFTQFVDIPNQNNLKDYETLES